MAGRLAMSLCAVQIWLHALSVNVGWRWLCASLRGALLGPSRVVVGHRRRVSCLQQRWGWSGGDDVVDTAT